jgi:hypothetical protein
MKQAGRERQKRTTNKHTHIYRAGEKNSILHANCMNFYQLTWKLLEITIILYMKLEITWK